MEGFLFYFSQEETDALEKYTGLESSSHHCQRACLSDTSPHLTANHTPVKDAYHGRKLHPSVHDRRSLKNYGAWSNSQIRRRASVWEACFASHQWQQGEDVWEVQVSKLCERGYLAIWQDDPAHVSGSEGEREVIEAAFWEVCFWRKLAFLVKWCQNSHERSPFPEMFEERCCRFQPVLEILLPLSRRSKA